MADLNIIKPAQVQTMINKFCCTIGMLPTSYKASLTYEGQILAIGHYLETVVYPAINQNAEALEELQGLFIALKDYVDNYFDNLDVQEEVNNKIDEMIEQGTLQEIIAQYIDENIQRTYDTNSDLIDDIGLTTGMNVKTLGKLEKNDGQGAYYTIVENAPTDLSNVTNNNRLDNYYLTLDNGLYAVPTNNINNDYYDEITTTTERINDTTCYFTTIPLNDNDSNEIELYVKNNSGMEISDYARQHKTTLSINATLAVINPDTDLYENASVISNGEIINDHMNPPTFLEDHYKFIGIKTNREIVDFKANETTAAQMIAQGVKEAWLCFGKFVDNGVITDYAQDTTDDITRYPHPRQALGIKLDKTVVILTCDGRTTYDKGLTGTETAQALIEKGCVNVYNLDGGGSTNTVFKGRRLNKYIDEHGTNERHIVYCLNAKKPTTNKNIDDINSNIGIDREEIIKQLIPIIPQPEIKNPADLNDIKTGLKLYSCYNTTNKPADAANYGYLLNIPIISDNNRLYGLYTKQFYFSRDDNKYWKRTLNNNNWTAWTRCDTLFGAEIAVTSNQNTGAGSTYTNVELGTVSSYYPNTITVANNQIKTTQACGGKLQALFNVVCAMDGEFTFRLRKNGSTQMTATVTGEAGKKYQILLNKSLSMGTNDYLDITCNSGTNTDNVNKISSGTINFQQNLV